MGEQQLDEKAIFKVACSIESSEARDDYLQQVCGNQPDLQKRVSRLLQVQAESPSFLEAPAVGVAATIQLPSPAERPGMCIGPYKLRELLGEGGMGSVYVAEQEKPVRRKVALKIIKPGMGSREVISRFESERQALALMDHPNIARVLDAGTTENGLPYFVMELVKGAPVTEHCDTQKLGTRDRLVLFLQVCQAIQHAHQKGIIHRDIKPSNVIVAVHDVMPVVKVIDFGVAKAIGQQLTEQTLYTAFSQMVGTPLYMSPEQAGQSSLDIDTRSDVYSLGVLLYELLTGNTPFDKDTLKQAGFDEMRRIIREVDPPKPSARVSTLNAEAQSTVAEQRQIEPRKLSQQFRGELDWIVMKAIEKDRNRRYDSAISFASDVRRFLDDLPVEASPPSSLYRLRKLARRHRVGLITSAALLCMMVVATALSTRYAFIADWALADSERDRRAADAQRAIADQQRTIAETRQKEADRLQQEAVAQRDATQQALYKADIRLAGIDYRDVNPLRLHNTLKTHIPAENAPDMRAWEWHYLLGASHQEATAILGHRRSVEDVAWSPDGKRIASTGDDGVRICDASTGVLIYENQDGPTLKIGGAWSPDSRRYAWGSLHTENIIRIWDSSTNEITSLRGHTFSLRQVCWSPDGRRLLSVSLDETCRIWDVDTQECLFVVRDDQKLSDACWNPMRERAAIARAGKGVLIINPTSGEIVTKTSEADNVRSVAFSADGTKLIVGENSGRCIIHDVDNWKVLLNFKAHDNGINGIAANPKYPSFATCGADGVAHIWRLADGKKHSTLFGHDGAVNGVDWDPTGLRLVTGSTDQRVLTWNVLESPTFHSISLGNAQASAINWDADSSHLSCTTGDGSIASIDIATRKIVKSPAKQAQDESDNQPKAAAMVEYLKTCDLNRNTKQKQFYFDSNKEAFLWTRDESRVATVAVKRGAKQIEIWDTREKALDFSLTVYEVQDAQWAPDHRRLAVAGEGHVNAGALMHAGWVYIINAESRVIQHSLRLESSRERESASAIDWNPSGTRIVAGNVTGLACIWDAADGRLLKSLAIHQATIQSLAWSPDSKRIASADSQGQVKILDAETLEELLTLSEGAGGVKQLAWSPDGRQLAGIHSNGNVINWNASRGFAYSNSDAFRRQVTSQNSDALLAEAKFHRKNAKKISDLDAALRVLDQLLQADTDHINAIFERGMIFNDLSRFTLAKADFERVYELFPEGQSNLYWLGKSQTNLGQFNEAITSLTAAYDASPESGDAPQQERAIAYILRGDVEKGQSELRLMSDKKPISFASRSLALLYISRGEANSYTELCKRVLENVHPGKTSQYDILQGCFTCCLAPQSIDNRQRLLSASKQIQEHSLLQSHWYHLNRGAVLFRTGEFEQAREHLQLSPSLGANHGGDDTIAYFFLALTQIALGQKDLASESLAKARSTAKEQYLNGIPPDWDQRQILETLESEAMSLLQPQ